MKFGVVVFICLTLISCTQRTIKEHYQEVNLVYGERIVIDVCLDSKSPGPIHEAMKSAWEGINSVSDKLDRKNSKTDIYKINHSYGNPVKVTDDVYDLIKEAISYTPLTNGTFDITVGALEDLWKRKFKENQVPSAEEIKDIQKAMGVSLIKFNTDHTIELTNSKTSLDFGGLGAGWAVDKAVHALHQYGYKDFMVAAAGDMYMSGNNCQGRPWQIGILNPLDKTKLIDVVSVSDMAVSTSGDYERFLVINGQKYSHVYNPITGYPQKGTTSATIISKTTVVKNDALAKAGCILSPQEAVKMIDSMGSDYAAYILYKFTVDKLLPFESQYYKKYKSKGNYR